MLGIDMLEADGFKAIAGKRIGLLTHAAGVNRRGESTINVLRRAPQTKLVCLFAPENGLDGTTKSAQRFNDFTHGPTGLPVYSIYGKNKRPTPEQLKRLNAVVVDLQDVGARSYTFISWMRYTMEACFEHDVEVIILDRPNPLGGLKVGGPPLDLKWMSDVGAFRIPYVHGLTMGELATMAKNAPGVLDVSEKVREKGKLTVIRMRGWNRAMRWPDTGLKWVPTSPMIQTYEAAVGYSLLGLGWQNNLWFSGIGKDYAFRSVGYAKKKPEEIIEAMNAYNVPGIHLSKREGLTSNGKPTSGVFVEISDWDTWNPTEFCFYMQKQAAKWATINPYANLTPAEQSTFLKHVGSMAWYEALRKEGGNVDVSRFTKSWRERSAAYQQSVKRFWLYP
ncbi:MAG: DUF1343 domain-containing protein [Dechloromonas sp.]|nr:MAG: DUF1343 domain-containing protein [Dechloromonas sp.]